MADVSRRRGVGVVVRWRFPCLPSSCLSETEFVLLARLQRRSGLSIVGSWARSRSTLAANSSRSLCTTCGPAVCLTVSRPWVASPGRLPMPGHSAPTTTATARASRTTYSQLTDSIVTTGAAACSAACVRSGGAYVSPFCDRGRRVVHSGGAAGRAALLDLDRAPAHALPRRAGDPRDSAVCR